jgi:hypothetical protein
MYCSSKFMILLKPVANIHGILIGKGFVLSCAAKQVKFLGHKCGQFLGVGIQIGQ